MTSAAIILAAGASTRLGSPKQLVSLQQETLLDRAIRTAREAGCAPIVVVLGANAARIQQACPLPDTQILINPDWQEGMASSLRLAIAALHGKDSTLVLTCDMPTVTPGHLQALVAGGTLTASAYAGCKGVPAFFPASTFPALCALKGDAGARALLQSAPTIPLPHGDLDVDTPEDLAAMHRLFSTQSSYGTSDV